MPLWVGDLQVPRQTAPYSAKRSIFTFRRQTGSASAKQAGLVAHSRMRKSRQAETSSRQQLNKLSARLIIAL